MLAMGLFTSCQKETESAQQLAEELTAELQKVTDYRTAEAAAPRVKVLNQRFQNASTQVLSLNFNPLAESVKPEEEGGVAPYVETITKLAKEIGRVRASKPVTTHDGEIDDTRLLQTVGANAGAGADAGAAATLKKGNEYMKNPTSRENNNPPDLPSATALMPWWTPCPTPPPWRSAPPTGILRNPCPPCPPR